MPLKEFLRDSNWWQSQSKTVKELSAASNEVFYFLTRFLSNSNLFPNREVNDVVSLMMKTILYNENPLIIATDVNHISFTDPSSPKKAIKVPHYLVEDVKRRPTSTLGSLAFVASEVRDQYTGRMKSAGKQEIIARACALTASTYFTIEEMAQAEHLRLTFNESQEKMLRDFPLGVFSLPAGIWYPTPIHRKAQEEHGHLQ